MNKVKVEILQRWTGVTFDWKPGDIVDLTPGEAEHLTAGGICKPVPADKPAAKPKKQE